MIIPHNNSDIKSYLLGNIYRSILKFLNVNHFAASEISLNANLELIFDLWTTHKLCQTVELVGNNGDDNSGINHNDNSNNN